MKYIRFYLLTFAFITNCFLSIEHGLAQELKTDVVFTGNLIQELEANNRTIPVFKLISEHLQITFGLLSKASTLKVYELSNADFEKINSLTVKLSNKFELKDVDNSVTLHTEGFELSLGKLLIESDLLGFDPNINSFKIAQYKPSSEASQLLILSDQNKVAAMALLSKEVPKAQGNKSLYYAFDAFLNSQVFLPERKDIFIYATKAFESVHNLQNQVDQKETEKNITALAENLAYWKKTIELTQDASQSLSIKSIDLINKLMSFAEVYLANGLDQSEVENFINSLKLEYPNYYALLAEIGVGKKDQNQSQNLSGQESKKEKVKKSKSKRGGKNKAEKNGRTQALRSLRSATVVREVKVKEPKIEFANFQYPAEAGVDPSLAVSGPCSSSYLRHPNQKSLLLSSKNINCDGSTRIALPISAVGVFFNSSDGEENDDNNLWGVRGLSFSTSKITKDLKFYQDSSSIREIKRIGGNKYTETIPHWQDKHEFTLSSNKIIARNLNGLTKEYEKIPNSSFEDYYLTTLKDDKGKVLLAYDYYPKTADPRIISFNYDPNTEKLERFIFLQNNNVITIKSTLPEDIFPTITVTLADEFSVKLPNYNRARNWSQGDYIEKKFKTIQSIQQGSIFTALIWDWAIQKLNERTSRIEADNSKNLTTYETHYWIPEHQYWNGNPAQRQTWLRPRPIAIRQSQVDEKVQRLSDGDQNIARRTYFNSASYFGYSMKGALTYFAEGPLGRYQTVKGSFSSTSVKYWEKLTYINRNTYLSGNVISQMKIDNKLKQQAIIGFKRHEAYDLLSQEQNYNDLGLFEFVYSDANKLFQLSEIKDPGYETVYNLINKIDRIGNSYHEFKTSAGSEQHTFEKKGSTEVKKEVYFDRAKRKLAEIEITFYPETGSFRQVNTIGDLVKTTTLIRNESDPSGNYNLREVETFKGKITKDVVSEVAADKISISDKVRDFDYIKTRTATSNTTVVREILENPDYGSFMNVRTETNQGATNATTVDKSYFNNRISSIQRQQVAGTENQNDFFSKVAGSKLWQKQTTGRTNDNSFTSQSFVSYGDIE